MKQQNFNKRGGNMDKPLLIWTPAICAQLKKQRRIKGATVYPLEKKLSSIEDVKIKVRHSEAKFQGSSVQVKFQLEFLCLMEGYQGDMLLAAWQGECQERVALTEFDNKFSDMEQVYMKLNFTECDGIGELIGNEICLDYYIEYSIIAAHEKIIEISANRQSEAAAVSLKAAMQKLEDEVLRVEGENGELRRRLFIYERDISSLKRGLWKAENRNAVLNREKKEHQALIEKLSTVIREQDLDAVQAKHNYFSEGINSNRAFLRPEEVSRLGGRIKRMFMNSN